MNALGLLVLIIGVAVSVAVTVLSHGRIVLIALPLLFALPLAGWFGWRR